MGEAMTEFNANHKRVLAAGLLDIHQRLVQLEADLMQDCNSSPLSKHVHDISPTEVKVLRDYLARMRGTLVTCFRENEIPMTVQRTSLRWTLQVGIDFIRIAIAELGPKKLQGYGSLSPAASERLLRLRRELDRLADRMATYLRQGLGRDLSERLARLDATSASVAMLTRINRIADRWRLVEFRPLIDAILTRLEHPRYEIAVFGRVNSGKSSLLNHLVGVDVLPVGVTPITAVPTRLVKGSAISATIQFAEHEAREVDHSRLAEYASEDGNSGNRKHVTAITVRVSTAKLPEGVVLVDTPGIGSLALVGGAEAMAYLPRCDLGILLVDAAAALNQDDLAVLRALYEAGIPANVLISKADLLKPTDRRRTAGYVKKQIQKELNLDLPIYPVSTMASHEALLWEWFEQQIQPMLQRHRELAGKSLQRKIAYLAESVTATLQTMANHGAGASDSAPAVAGVQAAKQRLEMAETAIFQAQKTCADWPMEADALVGRAFDEMARRVFDRPGTSRSTEQNIVANVVRNVLTQRTETARQVVSRLRQSLYEALTDLQQTTLVAGIDTSAVREFPVSELPILNLEPLRSHCFPAAPWWFRLMGRRAVPALGRRLKQAHGSLVDPIVQNYNEQLGVWMKQRVRRLAEIYQAQADIVRQQLRRQNSRPTEEERSEDTDELLADIAELRESGGEDTASIQPKRR